MKKITLSIIFLLFFMLLPNIIFAAGEDVAKVGEETFTTFDEALEAAKANGKDIEILKTIEVNKDVVINIEGVNIKGDANPLFLITDGSLKIEGKGTINANGDAFDLVGNTGSNWSTTAIKAELQIGKGVSVTSGECAIYLKGNGAKADVYGSLTSTGTYATIQGNGNVESGNTVINIYEGANILHGGDVAIYHPQSGKLTVKGGTIKGTTGIEMRAGNLIVEGGTIIGTGVPLKIEANGNGSTSYGAGIAIAQHTTKLASTATINGGTIQGFSALYQSNPEGNDANSIDKISIAVNGGKFEAINGGTVAVYSENKTEFIKGGTFNSGLESKYVDPTAELIMGENGSVSVIIIPETEKNETSQVVDPIPEPGVGEKDETPKTGSIIAQEYVWITLGLIALIGIVYEKRKTF